MHFCRYYHDGDALPRPVTELLEAEAFAGFCGDQDPAQPAGAQSPAGALSHPGASSPVDAFSPGGADRYHPLRQAVRRMVRTASIREHTTGNRELSERLAHDAVHWCDNQWLQSASSPIGDEEERFLGEVARNPSDSEAVAVIVSEAAARRPELQSLGESAARLIGEESIDGIAGLQRTVAAAAARERLTSEWAALVAADRTAQLTLTLRRAFAAFVSELNAVAPRFAERQSLVRDLFGSEDPLWDLSSGEWQEVPWRALEEAASSLAEHDELRRLAEVLGRSRVVTQNETSVREERDVRVETVGIGKSEVTGARFGDDLTSLLPSELALLSDPETEELFYAKLAHKELLVLDYRREKVVFHTRRRPVTVRERVVVPRGPVILCVDTSGSMIGLPEKVAKAMTLALAQRLQDDHRPIYVISFSTETVSFELTPDAPTLAQLAIFLGSSFRGGTDLRPAINEALDLLETNRYRHADVLVISDFRVPKIVDRYQTRLAKQQTRGTLFHSLTVADRPVTDPMHIFDHSYHFDISPAHQGVNPRSIRFFA